MRVAITGSRGLIGRALTRELRRRGHEVIRLVRSRDTQPMAQTTAILWDPVQGVGEPRRLEGVDAVVHLAGPGIGDRRWTESRKRLLHDARVEGTRNIAETLAGLQNRPRVFVSASAIGFYGDTGDETVDEDAPQGGGFLAELCRAWEEATGPAAEAGIRTMCIRTGLVLAPDGGLLSRLLPLFRLGLGGWPGDGRQWWSWISLEDEVRAILHLVDSEVNGPVNLVAPTPVTAREFAVELARSLCRRAFLPVPTLPLRLVLGSELVRELLLTSQRVTPRVLTASGFSFAHETIDEAFAWVVEKARPTP